jgi:hypothetical protein
MKSNAPSFKIPLLILCILAILLRWPGIFWGTESLTPLKFQFYIHDEKQMSDIAREFSDGFTDKTGLYPKGYSCQIGLTAKIVKRFTGHLTAAHFAMVGRGISMIYALLSILLLYFLICEVTANSRLAFFSSLMMSLTGLHVTRSHVAMPDMSLLFWIYASMYFALIYIRTKNMKYLVLLIISVGLEFAIKMPLMAFVPVVYIMLRDRWNWKPVLVVIGALFLIFIAANGGKYGFTNLLMTWNNVVQDNLTVREFNRLLNPVSYFFILIYSLGLPIFILSIFGIFKVVQNKMIFNKFKFWDITFIILLPLTIRFLMVCSLAFPADRHILPLVPLFSTLAAVGLWGMKESLGKAFNILITLVIFYQVVYVGSIEHNFKNDTRVQAEEWVKNNVQPGAKVALPKYSYLPSVTKNYKIASALKEADYIILHEAYYGRYTRSIMNPFSEFPRWEHVFHGKPHEYKMIQGLFKQEEPYALIQRFDLRFITPEMILSRAMFGNLWDGGMGDVLIFKRNATYDDASE